MLAELGYLSLLLAAALSLLQGITALAGIAARLPGPAALRQRRWR